MNRELYQTFMFLVDLPVSIGIYINIWFWLLLVVTPLLIFFVKVERSIVSYVLRVICAIGFTYVLLNLALHTKHNLEFEIYHQCQKYSDHWPGSKKAHDECSHHISPSGANYVFALGFGWIPAAFYIGVWEIIWRIRHRKKIKQMGKNYKGKWLSNITMSFTFIPLISFFILWLVMT